jgi:hypothetical protein
LRSACDRFSRIAKWIAATLPSGYFLEILEPGIFAHAGAGRISGYEPHWNLAFDVGLHAAWNRVFGDDDHDRLSDGRAGFHVALVL